MLLLWNFFYFQCLFKKKKKEGRVKSIYFSLPTTPTIFVVVMNLEPFASLLLLSYQFRTSSTAWGFFFCSCLLMLLDINNLAQASGIPWDKRKDLRSLAKHSTNYKIIPSYSTRVSAEIMIWYAVQNSLSFPF